jgi:DNA-binding beta-propeller fold protein YncE
VAVVLRDAGRRVAVLGGREGMPRSLGSVYGGAVTRFLGGGLRGVESRVIAMPGVKSENNGVAVSRDGCTLLVTDGCGGTHAIHEFSVADGSRLRVVGRRGKKPLHFNDPRQVWIAPDDLVFVSDRGNNRVQVLTPALDFHAFVGVGDLDGPVGVCADDDIVVVSEWGHLGVRRISVFNRAGGALLRRFGDDQLSLPCGLCFMSGHRHVAVADYSRHRVCVFSVDGELIRHVGDGKLRGPHGVACCAAGELVATDRGSKRVVVFDADGDEVVATIGRGGFTGVAMRGGTVVMYDYDTNKSVVFH